MKSKDLLEKKETEKKIRSNHYWWCDPKCPGNLLKKEANHHE